MALLDQINLNFLRVFLVVYRTKSMTHAAKELHLTQSGVSQQIKALEDGLGVVLFDRINRKIIPTSHAEVMFQECTKHLDDLELVLERIAGIKGQIAGRVRFGFPPMFGKHVILPLITRFVMEHPEVSFDFKIGLASDMLQLVNDGELDFAFIDAVAASPQMVVENIYTERLRLCGHQSLIKNYGKPEFSAKYFKQFPFVEFLPGEPFIRTWFQHNFGSVPHHFHVAATIMDSSGVAQLVQNGLGLGMIPELTLQSLNNPDLCMFDEQQALANPIGMAYLERRSVPTHVERFQSWLREEVRHFLAAPVQ